MIQSTSAGGQYAGVGDAFSRLEKHDFNYIHFIYIFCDLIALIYFIYSFIKLVFNLIMYSIINCQYIFNSFA